MYKSYQLPVVFYKKLNLDDVLPYPRISKILLTYTKDELLYESFRIIRHKPIHLEILNFVYVLWCLLNRRQFGQFSIHANNCLRIVFKIYNI